MVWNKRKRKRPRGGGVGASMADDNDQSDNCSRVQISVQQLNPSDKSDTRRVRIIKPYPFTFATYAKARWITRNILDVFHSEFGSYPRSYYSSAITQGRILVNGKRVDTEYAIKNGDVLLHSVHRHEPAVMVAPSTTSSPELLIQVVHEDDNVVVVDKPPTLPIHPCGGYNFNSLMYVLASQNDKYSRNALHGVHRLDRLTSGLVIFAKSKDVAKRLGQCLTNRLNCDKVSFLIWLCYL